MSGSATLFNSILFEEPYWNNFFLIVIMTERISENFVRFPTIRIRASILRPAGVRIQASPAQGGPENCPSPVFLLVTGTFFYLL